MKSRKFRVAVRSFQLFQFCLFAARNSNELKITKSEEQAFLYIRLIDTDIVPFAPDSNQRKYLDIQSLTLVLEFW